MRTLSAKDAKYGFGRLIDLARAEPVAVSKHGRTVVVVLSIEEYEKLKALEADIGMKTNCSDNEK
jgi:prevent-host-death family protein